MGYEEIAIFTTLMSIIFACGLLFGYMRFRSFIKSNKLLPDEIKEVQTMIDVKSHIDSDDIK